MSLLNVNNLTLQFDTDEGRITAVDDVSFELNSGEVLGLVGESGSGKSVTAKALMKLNPDNAVYNEQSSITLTLENDKIDVMSLKSGKDLQVIRGGAVSMIFQEPMASFAPAISIGDQMVEQLRLHKQINKREAADISIEMLDRVGISDAAKRFNQYAFELSGGMRQRAMIAMALACEPSLLIADEPTTALDVTIQKQILELLASLQKKYGMSVLFITHDLAVIADIADEVIVMYRGDIVEKGNTTQIFTDAKHPYTKGLLACRPALDRNPERLPTVDDFMTPDGKEKPFDVSGLTVAKGFRPITDENPVIMEIKNLKKYFPLKKNFWGQVKEHVKAVDDVSLQVRQGRTLGLVGESGCGKTTLGRTVLRLLESTAGQIIYKGKDITHMKGEELRNLRRNVQIIFQDPYASLNPRMTVGAAIMEPLIIHKVGKNKEERKKMAGDLMDKVGLSRDMLNRYPHEFSGGQRQRICIARALAVKPDFIVCDESVSALDVSVQAQILNLLLDLQDEFNLTYIFISHDLAVVKFISDELAVMNSGQVVEFADAVGIYENPKMDYTKKLLSAIPKGKPKALLNT